LSQSKTIAVGYTVAGVASLNALRPAGSIIVIEDPAIVRRRGIEAAVAALPGVDRVIAACHTDPGAVGALRAALADDDVVSVVPLNEYGTVAAARLAELFGVPGASHSAARVLRDKHLLRQVSAAGGIRNPSSKQVASLVEAQDFAIELGRPVILKPSNRQASVGTVIVRDIAKLPAAWKISQARDEGVLEPETALPPLTLVEEFVEGREYSVEALVRGGEFLFANVTTKTLYPGERPVERAHLVPADLPSGEYEQLLMETKRLMAATQFQTGIIHCEWLLRDEVPHLVECAGRFAGDGIIDLICRAYGFDIVAAYHALMRGEDPGPLPARAVQAAMVCFLDAPTGRVTTVTRDERALTAAGIKDVHIGVKPGDRIAPLVSSWQRPGSVTIEAPDAAAAQRLADEALRAIVITCEAEWELSDVHAH
jgi:biotin carboxylase